MTKITSVEQLKEMIANGTHDFFICLTGCLKSSKNIDYDPETKEFYIFNEIDGSEQEFHEEYFFNREYTNVGYAMENGKLYSYD